MELEQLKTVWKKTTDREVEGYFVSMEEVQRLIRKRSNTTISQVKRRIRNKILMAGTIGLMLLAFALYVLNAGEAVLDIFESFYDPSRNLEIGMFYLVFGLVICFVSLFNAFSYRKILDIEEQKNNLKTSIKNILAIVQNAIKVKIYSDTLVVPCTVFVLAVIDVVRGIGLFPNIIILSMFILGAIAFAIFSYFITKYSQNKRYESQIRTLEGCLEELEEEK